MHASPLSLTLSPLAVSVAGRAGHAFAPPSMLKGFECHARGVELLDTGRDHVRAKVHGPRPQEVALRVEGGLLHIKCTCPAESMTPDPCRHAWATLLEVDRQGALEDLRDKRGPVKVATEREEPPQEIPASSTSSGAPRAKRAERREKRREKRSGGAAGRSAVSPGTSPPPAANPSRRRASAAPSTAKATSNPRRPAATASQRGKAAAGKAKARKKSKT